MPVNFLAGVVLFYSSPVTAIARIKLCVESTCKSVSEQVSIEKDSAAVNPQPTYRKMVHVEAKLAEHGIHALPPPIAPKGALFVCRLCVCALTPLV